MLRAILIWAVCALPTLAAQPLKAITWNVQSGGADPAIISKQLGKLPTVAIYALQEVAPIDINRYGQAIREAHGKSYRYVNSQTGRGDRMLVAFDSDRLLLFAVAELFQYGEHTLNDWRHRCPLVCKFQDKLTGDNFAFLTVHMARGDEKLRQSQASGLAASAEARGEPVLAAGDFNFDFNFKKRRGNKAFDNFTRSGVWQWAKPKELVDTNWADRDGDGKDNYPGSCLDFAFYANLPESWIVSSEVIVRPGDFPDDERTSDHRPVLMTVERRR